MRVYGVDFTSAPKRGKSICVAACWLDGDVLSFERLERIGSLAAFEASLGASGPWVAGLDFPFTQPRTFLRNVGWPEPWTDYADHLATVKRDAFGAFLVDYKAGRQTGDKEHPRGFERGTGAASPMKLSGVPVGLMHHAGVPPLRRSGVHLPGLAEGDQSRVVFEAYPGVAARALIGTRPYKNDARAKQTEALAEARRDILAALTGAAGRARFSLAVAAPPWLAGDAGGDPLDALICAVQAAWAWRMVEGDPGRLAALDTSEGWIADPAVVGRLALRQA